MGNQSEADLRTERINQALNPNTQFYSISRSGHDMESHYSIPPSDEVEMGDDIPRDEIPRSSSSSMSVAHQSSAVADIDGKIERQRQIAEDERQQQENIFNQQLEQVKQNTENMLQEQAQPHREEAPIAPGCVNNLTETALNKLNKQSQELQQMAAKDERTRQRITAHKNQLRNQEKEQDSPERAKPKAKSEPFKFKAIDNVESGIKDKPNQKTAGDPETTHEPKGPRARPANIRRTIEKTT